MLRQCHEQVRTASYVILSGNYNRNKASTLPGPGREELIKRYASFQPVKRNFSIGLNHCQLPTK